MIATGWHMLKTGKEWPSDVFKLDVNDFGRYKKTSLAEGKQKLHNEVTDTTSRLGKRIHTEASIRYSTVPYTLFYF